eukprot:8698500-Pyramimonas_sp.AAC.2
MASVATHASDMWRIYRGLPGIKLYVRYHDRLWRLSGNRRKMGVVGVSIIEVYSHLPTTAQEANLRGSPLSLVYLGSIDGHSWEEVQSNHASSQGAPII